MRVAVRVPSASADKVSREIMKLELLTHLVLRPDSFARDLRLYLNCRRVDTFGRRVGRGAWPSSLGHRLYSGS